jgi:hypothetical protein
MAKRPGPAPRTGWAVASSIAFDQTSSRPRPLRRCCSVECMAAVAETDPADRPFMQSAPAPAPKASIATSTRTGRERRYTLKHSRPSKKHARAR